MAVRIQEVGPEALSRYAALPIAFAVESVLRVEPVDGGLGGLSLSEEKLDEPYLKDYDGQSGETPEDWPRRFDVPNWGFFLAVADGCDVGATAVAVDAPGVHMLERRRDLAVLWDIRVHPHHRRDGIGTSLFGRAARWAREAGCTLLKIETQNVNVPACRFYARQGCTLGAVNRYGYSGCASVAHEAMLLWYLHLEPDST